MWKPADIMFVARDRDGELFVFKDKPIRSSNENLSPAWDCWDVDGINGDLAMELNKGLFPNLRWEDEPIEVRLKELR